MSQSNALSNSQILRAALIVLVGFLASGLLGLVRTAVFSSTFGASAELDAFYAAQRIPETLFKLVAGGALGSSFIPVFSRLLNHDDLTDAWRLASAVMTLSAGAAAVLGVLMALFAPVIVPTFLVPGKSAEMQALTVSLTQLMLVTTVIFSISGLLMGILNAHQSFLLPSLALSMNNIGLIIGALFLTRFPTSESNANVYGLAYGAILGAVLHLIIQLPGLRPINAKLRILLNWRVDGVREVLTLMGPRVLGLAVVEINFAVNIAFASTMVDGSLVALNTAWFLMFFALGVIAQSFGTAVFPTLSALVAEDDMEGFKDRLSSAMRSVLFLSFPATVGLIVLGVPIVTVLFERGAWTTEDSNATAWALAFFALGIAGHSLLEVLSRAFYALHDTWTPVRIGIAAMVANIIFSIVFIQFVGEQDSLARGPFAGLALANSLTTLLEGGILWWLMRNRVGGIRDGYIIQGASRTLMAALMMGAGILLILLLIDSQAALVNLIVGGLVGVLVFFGLAVVMRVDEIWILLRRFKIIRS